MKAQNCLEKGGAYLQCVYNHCVKVELNAIETEGVNKILKSPCITKLLNFKFHKGNIPPSLFTALHDPSVLNNYIALHLTLYYKHPASQ